MAFLIKSFGAILLTTPKLVSPNSSVKKLSSLTVLSINSRINAIPIPTISPKATPIKIFNFFRGETGVKSGLAFEIIETLSVHS